MYLKVRVEDGPHEWKFWEVKDVRSSTGSETYGGVKEDVEIGRKHYLYINEIPVSAHEGIDMVMGLLCTGMDDREFSVYTNREAYLLNNDGKTLQRLN